MGNQPNSFCQQHLLPSLWEPAQNTTKGPSFQDEVQQVKGAIQKHPAWCEKMPWHCWGRALLVTWL